LERRRAELQGVTVPSLVKKINEPLFFSELYDIMMLPGDRIASRA
jgi:hypothetical protein